MVELHLGAPILPTQPPLLEHSLKITELDFGN